MIQIKNFTKETNLLSKGVYVITHKDTTIKYVGSTCCAGGFKDRWKRHLNGLLRGIGNRVLLNIFHKYGISGFNFSIIEILDNHNEKEIRERELFWIKKLDTYNHGANCSLDTNCSFKLSKHFPLTEIHKLKLQEASPNKKKVYMYNLDGVLLNTFESSVAADKFLGLRKGRVSEKISKQLFYNKSYFFSHYPINFVPKELMQKRNKDRAKKVVESHKKNGWIVTKEQRVKERINNPKSIKIELYDINTKNLVKIFNSLNECDDYLHLTRGATSKVLRGKAKTLKRKYIPKII